MGAYRCNVSVVRLPTEWPPWLFRRHQKFSYHLHGKQLFVVHAAAMRRFVQPEYLIAAQCANSHQEPVGGCTPSLTQNLAKRGSALNRAKTGVSRKSMVLTSRVSKARSY